MVYRNILVAVDGSDQARAALEHAAALARDQHSRITLVTVVPPVKAVAVAGSAQVVPMQQDCYREMLESAADAVPEDIGIVSILKHGKPAREIAELVENGDFDLVIMGAHGRGRVGDAVLGSVSRELLHRVRTPVLLVRSAPERSHN